MYTLVLFFGFIINTIFSNSIKYFTEILLAIFCWIMDLEIRKISTESNAGRANTKYSYFLHIKNGFKWKINASWDSSSYKFMDSTK